MYNFHFSLHSIKCPSETCVKQGKEERPKIKRELTAKAQTVEVM